ncbi:MAG: hypothetical protein LBT65_08230 [Synergistaceae bacterium]|jgi:hypothetical protein|nr:hypothetical protein [Synergistaceae bacterium]
MKNLKKILRGIVAAALLAALQDVPAGAAPAESFVKAYDLFTDKYSKLMEQEHVFQTAEFGQIYHYFLGGVHNGPSSFWATLVRDKDGKETWRNKRGYEVNVKSGNHVFLLGGTWSAALQASIGYINDVAKEYGVPAIYNFDPHLDGRADSGIDIFADPGQPSNYGTTEEFRTKVYYRERGDALATALLSYNDGLDPDGRISADELKVPSIIIWNRNNPEAPVVAQYTWDEAKAADETAFKSDLRAVFEKIAVGSGTQKKATDIVSVSPSDYFIENENARFRDFLGGSRIPLLTVDGQPITVDGVAQTGKNLTLFTEADTYTPFEVVTYEELRGALATPGNHAFVFAGQWCPNTYANLRDIHDYAIQYNVQKVYFFDPELDATFNNSITAVRNSDRTFVSGMYMDLLADVLTNIGPDGIPTQFDDAYENYIVSENMRRAEKGQASLTDDERLQIRLTNAGNSGDGYSIYQKKPGNTDKGCAPIENAKWVSRLQQPTLVLYNREHRDASGKPAPVISMFEQMWFSGGNMSAPGTFGYAASRRGRILEFQEYTWRDGKQPDTLHNLGVYDITNNLSIPKTSIVEYSATGKAGGADKRGVNAPVTRRSYWRGLNETLNAFGVAVLEDLIVQAVGASADKYTAENYAALQAALEVAQTTVNDVRAADAAAKAADLTKVSTPVSASLSDVSKARLTATEQVGSFTDQSAEIKAAYSSLRTALEKLQ